ncbi:MAG: peptidoglycan glycosyltransferase [Saprospiraceae bacterium]|nr:peptidoglycan glycosyltransferase [Saprospiraceae bacterium]
MDRKKELLIRVYVILGLFGCVAAYMIYHAIKIVAIEGDEWRQKGEELYFKLVSIEAERGKILSDDGSPLALSLPFFEIRMDTRAKGLTSELFNAKVDSLAACLVRDLYQEKSLNEVKNWLVRERKAKNRYLLIARSLDYNQLEELRTYPILRSGQNKGGLIVIRKDRREKPFKLLASRTIGLKRENAPSIGLESSFDPWLKGEEGQRLMKKVGPDLYLPVDEVIEIEAKRGKDIKTTIDIGIQEVAEEALSEAILNHGAQKGCAVVMDVKTGAIKAIANLGLDASGQIVEDFNYALGYSTEPGSTMKLASVAAMLEEGKVDLKTAVQLNGGEAYFYNKKMKDSESHGVGMSDLQYSFEKSSNVGISRLAYEVFGSGEGQKKFAEYYKKFRLHKKSGIELEGESVPVVKHPVEDKDKWYGTSVPWMSVGYEIQLTPLQILNFYNAVANRGVMMKPYIVSQILDDDKVVKAIEPKVLQQELFSEKTLTQLNILLAGVVTNGTGKVIQSEQFNISGKTGTAVTNYYLTGLEQKQYQASFCGFPSENPIYSCIVVIYNPTQGGYYGGQAAAPAFLKIADKCMRDKKLVATLVNDQPKPLLANEVLPVGNHGFSKDFQKLFNHIGLPFHEAKNNEWVRTISNNDGIYTLPQQVDIKKVPDLAGMGLRDALYILDKQGVLASVSGVGKVVWQSLEPGVLWTDQNRRIEIQLQ